jgi:hypothetical protein
MTTRKYWRCVAHFRKPGGGFGSATKVALAPDRDKARSIVKWLLRTHQREALIRIDAYSIAPHEVTF